MLNAYHAFLYPVVELQGLGPEHCDHVLEHGSCVVQEQARIHVRPEDFCGYDLAIMLSSGLSVNTEVPAKLSCAAARTSRKHNRPCAAASQRQQAQQTQQAQQIQEGSARLSFPTPPDVPVDLVRVLA
eukprot:1157842-Pelagomonas_calceolata.AAC.12